MRYRTLATMTVTMQLAEEAVALSGDWTTAETRVFFAPGRANLLGAHMDYNGGWVMPVALSRGTCAAVTPTKSGLLRLRSAQFPEEFISVPLKDLRPGRTQGWSAYAEGAIHVAMQAWGGLSGLDVALAADLPMAKGLSSSASVESVMVFALSHLLDVNPSVDEMIRLAHAAETEYVGVRCGILDQTAIFLAKENFVLRFDCTELTREYFPMDATKVLVAVMDTGVARELASSAFNARVAECTKALALIQERVPGIFCLRDVKRADLEAHADVLPPVLKRRVQHVVGEVERTEFGARALGRGDIAGFGASMTAAHDSLRDLFEVSTPELNAMVEAAVASPGCYGARLTGAGFGGCVVALVNPKDVSDFESSVCEAYESNTGRSTKVQWFQPSGGPVECFMNP